MCEPLLLSPLCRVSGSRSRSGDDESRFGLPDYYLQSKQVLDNNAIPERGRSVHDAVLVLLFYHFKRFVPEQATGERGTAKSTTVPTPKPRSIAGPF